MKSSANAKTKSTTSPKNKKHVAKDKEKTEKRRAENHGPSCGNGKMDASELIALMMGENQYARLSYESVLNYAEQSIFEHVPHEVTFSLAEDLSYKLRHIIHDAQIKANLCGRSALLGSDIEASLENLAIEKVFGACSNANFMHLTDKHLYLDDTLVNLAQLAEETGTVLQPGDAILGKQCYSAATATQKNYVRYFDTMCRALICNAPKLQQDALRDVRRNARIGPIVNWFYHFGYFLLSKDITYVSLTLSALNLIEALESNPIARQLVAEKELKLLLRLILQRLLRTHTDHEVIKPMCNVLATLCRRAPLRDLVINKIAQRRKEFDVEYALPLVCIINALGVDALQTFVNHLLNLYQIAETERKAHRVNSLTTFQLVFEMQSSYHLLCAHDAATTAQSWAFYETFDDMLVPFWRPGCGCPSEKVDNVRAQLLRSRRRILAHSQAGRPESLHARDVFEPGASKRAFIKWNVNTVAAIGAIGTDWDRGPKLSRRRQEMVTVGRWGAFRGKREEANDVKTCLNYLYMVL